ncbi:MAG TPA: substrate-binding domain-containing protein [Micromonosporaceae bacterium]
MPVSLVAAGVVLAVLAWSAYSFFVQQLGGDQCASPTTIEIAAAPEIAAAINDVATAEPRQGENGEGCWQVRVISAEPQQTAAALARPESQEDTAENGKPDVWVPDSTFWLRQARAGGAFDVPGEGVSIASSPVVLATVEPVAQRLGWPERLDWQKVIGSPESRDPIRTGIADPGHSPVGLSGLIAIDRATAESDEPGANRVAALRQVSKNVSAVASDLFGKLPADDDPTTLATALAAFPASEQSVLSYNSRALMVPLVPVYAAKPGPSLDYPYTVMPGTPKRVRDAAEGFLTTMLTDAAREPFTSRGFRTPRGDTGPGFPTTRGTEQQRLEPVVLPDAASVEQLLTVWTGINRSGRIIAVVDVSGSMNEPVPGTKMTRMEITRLAVMQGIPLFKDTTEMGVWIFSTNLDGEKDYRELVPIGPLYANKNKALAAASSFRAVEGGGTGLYDTTLAAYKVARKRWDPARINVVLLLTDGQNEDANGISRQALLSQLKKLADPRKPVAIINIGIGPDVDRGELKSISDVTAGHSFVTRDPTKIGDVFLAALAVLTGNRR